MATVYSICGALWYIAVIECMKILFLCRGNVARSQMAEALFNKKWKGEHEAISAGTELSGPEQTLESLAEKCQSVIDVLDEEGVDVRDAMRKQLTPSMAEASDMVIGIFDENNELDAESIKAGKDMYDAVWSVPDPKGTDLETHRAVKDKIKIFVQEMNL